MHVRDTALPGVLIIEPHVHGDARGFFLELWQSRRYAEAGLPPAFLQDNLSRSARGIVRGLHYQEPHAQGKLVSCLQGAIYDVVVDIRRGSPHFGRWFGVELSDASRQQIWVPPGYAHGFCVLSDTADVLYKSTDIYHPEHEHGVRWDDPAVAIEWPVSEPLLSEKDRKLPLLSEARVLPVFAG